MDIRLFSLLMALIMAAGCTHKMRPQNSSVTVRSYAHVQPLLKGMKHNAIIRLGIYQPITAAGETVKVIELKLNDAARASIDKFELYNTGIETAFSTSKLVGTARSEGATINVSLNLALKPGWNYLWLDAHVREDANMDARPEVHISRVEFSKSKTTEIAEQGDYKRRIGVAVRKANDDGVHTYRIPGIATTTKGSLIAVYDIRYKHSGDLPANIDVGMSRSTDGGKTWEPMKVIMDMGAPHENNGIGDPAVLVDPATGKIWVAALWSKGNRSIAGSQPGLSPDTTGQFMLASSDDDGLTWSHPYNITTQVKDPKWHLYFNGPGNGIVMKDGTLVFPSQYWDESTKPGLPHSSIIYSRDNGKTWRSGIGAKANTTESQVVETTPGTLMLNMRDNRGRFRSVSITKDLGKTWVEHITSYNTLVDPVCMASFIKAEVNVPGKGNSEVLFFGNVASPSTRHNMTVKASLDLGETWPHKYELLIDERMTYGYSALTRIDANSLGYLYEGERDLYFVRIPVSELIK